MQTVVDALLVGAVRPLGAAGHLSGIGKQPVTGPLWLGVNGLEMDGQADVRHGGPDKAVHHYAYDHYPFWRDAVGARKVLDAPGAFGENLSTLGMTEENVCIGDVFQLGGALVEVSQTRQPCWKLNLRFDARTMALQLQRSGKTGWYYRVLAPGLVAAGDAMHLVRRPRPEWSLARLIEALYHRLADEKMLSELSQLPELPVRWRELFARRLSTGEIEDWSERLDNASGE